MPFIKESLWGLALVIPYLFIRAHTNIVNRLTRQIEELEINAVKKKSLKVSIDPVTDRHPTNGFSYLRGRIRNEGLTVEDVSVYLIGFRSQGATGNQPKDIELWWTGNEIGPKDINKGKPEIFDIGRIQRAGNNNRLHIIGQIGTTTILGREWLEQGQYKLNVVVTGKDLDPIEVPFVVRVGQNGGENVAELVN